MEVLLGCSLLPPIYTALAWSASKGIGKRPLPRLGSEIGCSGCPDPPRRSCHNGPCYLSLILLFRILSGIWCLRPCCQIPCRMWVKVTHQGSHVCIGRFQLSQLVLLEAWLSCSNFTSNILAFIATSADKISAISTWSNASAEAFSCRRSSL